MTQPVRTRFAPSPTGYMHVGNLRTALYAFLLARKNNGQFLLRIEDTDQERFTEGATELIYNTLAETGLYHDEGPDIGGEYGPYVQSERRPIYKEYAEKLIESGHAYRCFCNKDRLELLRKQAAAGDAPPKYDGKCSHLSSHEIQENLKNGVPYVVRQKIPQQGTTTFVDEVFGSITVDNSTLDDQVLLKTDGLPTYNFANVIDDHLMKISHVIRGSEYLSSTPKYNLLYEAFGWEIPKYVHVSAVMRDAQHKLSKRDGDASYKDFIDKGYLKDAVMNYIALLGWNPGDEREKFTLEQLVQAFDIAGISKSPAIFDVAKLDWLNGLYIRELSPESFRQKATPWIEKTVTRKDIDFNVLCAVLQTRTEKLSDIPEQVDFIDAIPEYSPELYIHKKSKTTYENSLLSLETILPVLDQLPVWDHTHIHDALMAVVEKMGVKTGIILWPLRVALSGKAFTPGGGIELAEILGKQESLIRIRKGIEILKKTLS